eukprot:IDg4864t1
MRRIPPAQLISVHIESVDPRIRTILREAREDKNRRTLLELCWKAVNHGETLERKLKPRKEHSRNRGMLRHSLPVVEDGLIQEINLLERGEHGHEYHTIESDLTTNLPTNTAPSTKTVQTDEHAF